jgi:hypothetical protein
MWAHMCVHMSTSLANFTPSGQVLLVMQLPTREYTIVAADILDDKREGMEFVSLDGAIV